MPLNLKDGEESGQTGGFREGPPVHKPKMGMSNGAKATVIIAVLIVVGVAVFMMYKAGIFGKKKGPPPESVFAQPVDTMVSAAPAESETAETVPPEKIEKSIAPKLEVKNEAKSPPKPTGTGQYTIYIGLYASKSIADEEAGRWNDAGYHAFVNEASGPMGASYRVCLGRYGSKTEARQEAEKLKDAFEGGYWVDMAR
jgi:cell division septation protein DedD